MFEERTYYIHAVSPIHVGAGRGLGHIDLPVMREKITGWPFIPGSTVKGVLAAYYGATIEARKEKENLRAAFGISDDIGKDSLSNAGSLVFADAKLLALPIRSFKGTFAWVTSPLVLRRSSKELKLNGGDIPSIEDGKIAIAGNFLLCNANKVFLNDLDFEKTADQVTNMAKQIAAHVFPGDDAWQQIFVERFAIVSDDVFSFLTTAGTEVNARIKIEDETKVVQDGALWYEEYLPIETILVGVVWCDKVFSKAYKGNSESLINEFCKDVTPLQIGGKGSIGKGLVNMLFSKGE